MGKIKKIITVLLLIFMAFPISTAAEGETIDAIIPYSVNGGSQPIEIYDGDQLIYSDEISGTGNIVLKVPKSPENFRYLLKAVPGTDESLIYDNSEYDIFVSNFYEGDQLNSLVVIAVRNSELKKLEIALNISPKPITNFPLNLLKIKQDGSPLPGAELSITSEDFEETYFTTSTAKTLYLEPGEYTVEELSAPTNFNKIPTFTLIVAEDGTVSVPENDFLIYDEGEILLKIIDPDKLSSVLVVHKTVDGEILKDIEYVCKDKKIGTSYTTTELEFKGYEFVRMDEESAPASGQVKEEEQTVIYLYQPVKKGSVLVVHKDIDTGEVLKDIEYVCKDCEVETPYETSEEEFKDYTFVKVDEEFAPATGEVEEGEKTVVYLYRKNPPIPPEPKKGSVLVVYKTEDGQTLKEIEYVCKDCEIDTDYNTTQLEFKGYKFVKMDDTSAPRSGKVMEEDQTVIYIYKKVVGSVLVVYKTEDGQILKDISYLIKNGTPGDPYSTEKLTFDGYEFIRVDGNASGSVVEGEITITYIYRKIVPVTPTPSAPPVNTGFGQETAIYVGGAAVALVAAIGLIVYLSKKKKKEE